MKNKLFSIFTALAMVLGILVSPFTSAHAADGETSTEATETKSVTIHKILLTKAQLDAHDKDKKYDGNKITDLKGFFAEGWKDGDHVPTEIDGVYFKLQQPAKGVTNPDVNKDEDWVDVAGKDGKTEGGAGLKLDTTGLKGTYRIVEDLEKSTYKGKDGELLAASKAVPTLLTLPITNNEGVVEDAHVYPKNTQEKPEIDKNFAANNDLGTVKDDQKNQKVGAKYENYQKEKATVTADLGKKIPYEVKTKIKKDSKYKKLVWNDNMTKGLTYQKDLKITSDQLTGENALTADDYFVTETDRGFTLVLKESGRTKVENAAKAGNVEITLTYSAKINGEAVVDKPELNDIALDYANKPGKDSEPEELTPVNKEITVKKSWDITGDDKITEADKGVTAYFTLQKKNDKGEWEDVETVEKTVPQTKEPAAQDSFTHTFKNLEENGTYRVVESVKGYEAEYKKYNETTGELEITNHKDTDNPDQLNPTEPKVQLGGRKFVKTNNENKDSAKLERLAGAEFYVKNAEGKYLVAAKKPFTPTEEQKDDPVTAAKKALDEAVKAYNELSAEDQKGKKGTAAKNLINDKQDAYNKAFKENATEYTWGEKTDPNVVVLTSDAEGRIEIKGLEYKAGYELEEKTAPKGYAKLQSNPKFEVKEGSYASTADELQYNKDDANNGYGLQIKNKNVSIPQTGGIGSLIFVVAGLAIMAFAYTAYKKSQYQEA